MNFEDEGSVFYTNQRLRTDEIESDELTPAVARSRFREFIRNFREDGHNFIYREQLLQRYRKAEYYLEVILDDLHTYDPDLQDLIQQQPRVYLPQLENAARDVLSHLEVFRNDIERENLPEIQIVLKSSQTQSPIRSITASDVNGLVCVPGIIISASTTQAKAVTISCQCKCGHSVQLPVNGPFGGAVFPRQCQAPRAPEEANECGPEPYSILPDKCKFTDQQTLKLQESPEEVPTGEMPRHLMLILDRYLVDQVSPGTRVNVLGVSSVISSKKTGSVQVRTPYLYVVGITVENEGSGRAHATFTPEEEESFVKLARYPDIYEKITTSIAPAISGEYTVDLKKAIACLLFSGSRKILPDGTKLRGDINVLLLGDPSTAKSQFLKFVEKVAPVGVYTSGKGSSAAGLTASVVKDSRGEFYLEGGAMVLADGGVVCIDEFDKMGENDRVAIHEAMEQQTISVAKAGITTILNSRASVLAAANPVYGRYDDSISAAENIDFMPTILSRFDLIFIVRDIRDAARDELMARHVMGVHMNANSGETSVEGEIDVSVMKRFVSYARTKCAPHLSETAANTLRDHYVRIREDVRVRAEETGDMATVPITVRQLEAIVRISESLAKMSLSIEVTADHVTESIRLFKVSTLNAASNSQEMGSSSNSQDTMLVEDQLKRRIAIGASVSVHKIMLEFERSGFESYSIRRAMKVMASRGEAEFRNQRKSFRRTR